MFFKKTIDEIQKIISKKNYFLLIILGFLLIILSILEFIGIGLIPIYISLMLDPQIIFQKFDLYRLNKIIQSTDKDQLMIYASLILLFIFIFKNFLLSFIIYFQGKVIKKIKIELSNKIFNNYMKLELKNFLLKNSSVFIRTINLDVGNTSIFMLSILSLVKEILLLFTICILLLIAEPVISISLFIYFFIFFYSFYFFTKKNLFLRKKKIQQLSSDVIKLINETLGSIKEIKIFNLEKKKSYFFLKNISLNEEYAFKNYFIKSLPRLYLEILSVLAIVLIIIFYIYSGKELINVLPFLSLIVISAIRLIPSLNSVQTTLSTLRTIMPSYNHIKSEIKYLEENVKLQTNKKDIIFKNKINLRDLGFSYDNKNNFVLKNVNLSINNGDKIGIVGKSGSGKTTLVNMILGLLEPSTGEIIVDDKKIVYEVDAWGDNVAYVPQETYLIDDTIKKNILFGLDEDEDTEKNLEAVCKKAQIFEFINSLNEMYNTKVGERGVNLSIGQKQRIGIARALYNNPEILIFDEATSALNAEIEDEIIDQIYQLKENVTLVIITHKPSILKNCNKIYKMVNGHLLIQKE